MSSPLRTIGWGLVIVLLDFRFNGFDVLLDPIGWFMVLGALGRLAGGDPRVGPARTFVVLAAVLSFVEVLTPGGDTPDWYSFLLTVAGVVYGVALILIAGYLAVRAGAAGASDDERTWTLMQRWLIAVEVGTALVGGLLFLQVEVPIPALLVGVGIVLLVVVSTVILCFNHARRPWAAQPRAQAA